MKRQSSMEAIIQILVPWERAESANPLASELKSRGLFPIIQPIDSKQEKELGVITGGASPDAAVIVVDLGDLSVPRVHGLLEYCPELEGRFIVVGFPDEQLKRRNVIFVESEELIQSIERMLGNGGATQGSA